MELLETSKDLFVRDEYSRWVRWAEWAEFGTGLYPIAAYFGMRVRVSATESSLLALAANGNQRKSGHNSVTELFPKL